MGHYKNRLNDKSQDIKCRGCNVPQWYINFPHNPNKKIDPLNMLQEDSIVNDIAINVPRINFSLEDWQAEHQ